MDLKWKGSPAMGEGRFALDRNGRRQLAGLAWDHGRSTGTRPAFPKPGRGSKECRILACISSRYGRIKPVSRRAENDLWPHQRLSRITRPGFNGSCANRNYREQGRSEEYPFHCFEQVGEYAGTEHFQAVLLRTRETGN